MVIKKERFKYSLSNWLITILIIVSLYGNYIDKMYDDLGTFIQIVLIACMGLMTFRKGFLINRMLALPFCMCVLICIVQSVIHFPSIGPIKNLLYLVVFLCVLITADGNTWRLIRKTIIIVSIFMTIDALVNLPVVIAQNYNWYHVRRYTMLDKPLYSILLTFSVVLLMLDVFYKREKRAIGTIIIIAVELFVNIAIMQSKAGVLCLVGAMGVLMIKAPREVQRRLISAFAAIVVLVVIISIVKPNLVPEYLKVMANRYLGLFDDVILDYVRYTQTYDLRSEIYKMGINLVLKNPWFGIGFGNYAKYGMVQFNIPETESSILNTFVEGGVIYGISHIVMVLLLLVALLKVNKQAHWKDTGTEIFLIMLLYFVFNFQNDYMITMYWCILGIAYRVGFNKNKCIAGNR